MRHELENAVELMHSAGVNYEAAVRTFKRLYIVMALERHKGNKVRTARSLGMHRKTIRRIMDDLHISLREDPEPISRETEGAA
jgi:DNA-binding NtrC family response regulator